MKYSRVIIQMKAIGLRFIVLFIVQYKVAPITSKFVDKILKIEDIESKFLRLSNWLLCTECLRNESVD